MAEAGKSGGMLEEERCGEPAVFLLSYGLPWAGPPWLRSGVGLWGSESSRGAPSPGEVSADPP